MESEFLNTSVKPMPLVDKHAWGKLFEQDNVGALSEHFLHHLNWFQEAQLVVIGDVLKQEIDQFIETFLDYFARPEFTVPNEHLMAYLSSNALIANLAAISDFRTTDKWLKILVRDNQPVVKILTLYSTRNAHRIDTDSLFNAHPFMASQWYASQGNSLRYSVQAEHFENGRKLLAEFPARYQVISPITLSGSYYVSTYIAPDHEPAYKSMLNEVISRDCPVLQQKGMPNPKKIAIITRRWQHGFAVHRSLWHYIHSLQNHYELTLVHIGKMNALVDTDGFSDVRTFENMSDVRNLTDSQRRTVEDQDWSFIFYPDIGMDCESIYLANQRLAPVQAAGYGHPASTHSKEIDYYFAGQAVEKVDPASGYFSERLVLLPGIGMYPVWPVIDIEEPVASAKPGWVSINCAWSGNKIQPDLVADMKSIIASSRKPVRFRIFSGAEGIDDAGHPVYRNELEKLLGKKHIEFLPMMSLNEYYREMLSGQITMMSFPFSGYNTVVDSLYLSIPVVARSGEHGYSNFPVQLLCDIGMQELTAGSRDEYIRNIIRLVDDDQYRASMSERISACNLQKLIEKGFDENVFCRAVDYLLENHDSLGTDSGRAPVQVT